MQYQGQAANHELAFMSNPSPFGQLKSIANGFISRSLILLFLFNTSSELRLEVGDIDLLDKVCSEIKVTFCLCVHVLEECKECHGHKDTPAAAAVHPDTEALKERPVEEVAARLAQQDQEEQDIVTCRLDTHTQNKACQPPEFVRSLYLMHCFVILNFLLRMVNSNIKHYFHTY